MKRFVLYFCSLLLLSACGSKGPLVLPPKPATTAFAPVPQALPADDNTLSGAFR